MSLFWHNLRIAQLGEESDSISGILSELSNSDPKLAQELAAVDWVSLRKYVMGLALKDVSDKFDASLEKRFDNSSVHGSKSGDPPNGECVGVIRSGTFLQIGVSVEDDGHFNLYWNVGGEAHHANELEKWKEAIGDCFSKRLLAAAVELCADTTKTQSLPDGTFVVVGTRN
mgnify:CR=1 FL=1